MPEERPRQGADTNPGSVVDVVWAMIGRRKWLALWAFALPCITIVSLTMFLPALYRSTATVVVDGQQVPEFFVQSTVTSGLEARLHAISQEIFSRSRLETIIARFRLYEDLKKRVSSEEVIDRMRSDIGLELKSFDKGGGQKGTVAFALSFRGANPQTVAQVTNTLASFFIEENLRVRERQAAGTAEFLKVQLDQTKKRLDEQERDLGEFKSRHLGALPQQADMNIAALERLDAQLRMNLDHQGQLLARRESLARLAGDRAAGGGALDDPRTQLARAREELRQLRTRFSDRYPDVVRLTKDIESLEQEIKSTPPGTPTEPRDPELRVLKAEERRLRDAIAAYNTRILNAPKIEQQYKELTRDYESTRELFAALSKRYDQALIGESMEQRQKGEQFRIVDPAMPPNEPVAPNRLKLNLMALGLSLGFSVAVVFVAERVHPSFHSVAALRAFTTAPVLLSIPKIVTANDKRNRQRQTRMGVALTAAGLAVVVGITYLVAHGNEYLVSLLARGRL